MLSIFRYLLLPPAAVYAAGAWLRRLYFRLCGRRKSSSIYTIAIGNLAVGGSGKTPMALFIAQQLKSNTALLSRGYKRKTNGFREVQVHDSAENCGDEPLEMKNAAPEIPVFVCENRYEGIRQMQCSYPNIQRVILDDAFQHLPLKATKYVLLTDFQKPFYSDLPMPAGNLREFACTASEADVIVVTKCPADLTEQKAETIGKKLEKYEKPFFFCHYENAVPVNNAGETLTRGAQVVSVSGLAQNNVFRNWAAANYTLLSFHGYPDHHTFCDTDYLQWAGELEKHSNAILLTTRKDFARMDKLPEGLKKLTFITFTTPKFLFQQEDAFIRILFNHF